MAGPMKKGKASAPKFRSGIGTAVAVKRLPNGKMVNANPRSNPSPSKGPRKGSRVAY